MNKDAPKAGKKDTSWSSVAGWYDGLLEGNDDLFQSKVIMPNILRILDLKPDMAVLDIACGQGYFSRAFAQNGALVTACDISKELIEVAKKRSLEKAPNGSSPGAPIVYQVAPADKLAFAADQSFDAATIILALQNIENLAGTVAETARVLKKGGRLILVVNHPAFRIPQRSSWEWSDVDAKQYRRIDAYLSDARVDIDMTPGEPDPKRKKMTISFHRPFQSYFKAINKNGFAVTRLEEWISHRQSQKGPRAAEEDRTRKEIPMFLLLEAKRD